MLQNSIAYQVSNPSICFEFVLFKYIFYVSYIHCKCHLKQVQTNFLIILEIKVTPEAPWENKVHFSLTSFKKKKKLKQE